MRRLTMVLGRIFLWSFQEDTVHIACQHCRGPVLATRLLMPRLAKDLAKSFLSDYWGVF